MKHSTFAFGSGFIVLAAGGVSAAVTGTVTDQGTVEASLGSFTVEDFEDETLGNIDQFAGAAFSGFSVSVVNPIGTTGDFAIGGFDGGQALNIFPDVGATFPDAFTFTFDSPVDTFAATFNSPQSADGLTFSFDNGDFIDTQSVVGLDGLGLNYVSFVSDTLFTSVTIGTTGLEAVTIDNVVAGVIPAPGAAGVLGLAGLVVVRRRR